MRCPRPSATWSKDTRAGKWSSISWPRTSARVSLLQVAEGLGHLIQRISLVDDRCDLSRLHEIADDLQVLRIQFGEHHAELLVNERRQDFCPGQSTQKSDQPLVVRTSDHHVDAFRVHHV